VTRAGYFSGASLKRNGRRGEGTDDNDNDNDDAGWDFGVHTHDRRGTQLFTVDTRTDRRFAMPAGDHGRSRPPPISPSGRENAVE
jgi:hypothetical protein